MRHRYTATPAAKETLVSARSRKLGLEASVVSVNCDKQSVTRVRRAGVHSHRTVIKVILNSLGSTSDLADLMESSFALRV